MLSKSKNLLLGLFFIAVNLFAQENQTVINQLKKAKQTKEKEIKDISVQIKKLKNQHKSLKGSTENKNREIILATEKFEKQDSLIDIQYELIKNKEAAIKIKEEKIKLEEENLRSLKESYKKLLYQKYIWKNTHNETYFLLSSKDLNQLFQRKEDLKFLRNYRFEQLKKIKQKTKLLIDQKEVLNQEIEGLIKQKNEKEKLRNEAEKLKQDLIREQEEIETLQSTTLEKIKKSQNEKREEEAKIQKLLKEIIKEQENKEKDSKLSEIFSENKGNLPWPIEKGEIIGFFGEQQTGSGIKTINNGIDFKVSVGEICRSIAKGKVSRIFFLKGKGKAVLINHGEFFTLYSGLQNVEVKTNEKVIEKQVIGTVTTIKTNLTTILHFEIWKGKEPQNPVKWLYSRD